MKRIFKEIRKYPSAIVGLVMIAALIVFSIYTIIKIPYAEAVRQWRGGEEIWYQYPRNAEPIWVNWFSKKRNRKTLYCLP